MNKNTQKNNTIIKIILYLIASSLAFIGFFNLVCVFLNGTFLYIEEESWPFIIFIISISLTLSYFIFFKLIIQKKLRSSAKYQEKCYKQINRIHTYYEKGSITEEEFNKLKQKILNQICD